MPLDPDLAALFAQLRALDIDADEAVKTVALVARFSPDAISEPPACAGKRCSLPTTGGSTF